jgi:hypothetical protein
LATNLFKGVVAKSGGVMMPNDPQNMYTWHNTVENAEELTANWLISKGFDPKITAKQLRELPLDYLIEPKLIFDRGKVCFNKNKLN